MLLSPAGFKHATAAPQRGVLQARLLALPPGKLLAPCFVPRACSSQFGEMQLPAYSQRQPSQPNTMSHPGRIGSANQYEMCQLLASKTASLSEYQGVHCKQDDSDSFTQLPNTGIPVISGQNSIVQQDATSRTVNVRISECANPAQHSARFRPDPACAVVPPSCAA